MAGVPGCGHVAGLGRRVEEEGGQARSGAGRGVGEETLAEGRRKEREKGKKEKRKEKREMKKGK
jgi:hypothetical protein